MPQIGPMEIVIVLVIALLVFGPKKLPELGRGLGSGLRDFKKGLAGDDDDREPARVDAAPVVAAAPVQEPAPAPVTPVPAPPAPPTPSA